MDGEIVEGLQSYARVVPEFRRRAVMALSDDVIGNTRVLQVRTVGSIPAHPATI